MDLDRAPAALEEAEARVQALGAELPALAAARILATARPPRRTGALAATGRVDGGAVVYGGGVVDYAPPVHAANPFLARAAEDLELLDLADDMLTEAISL